MKSEKVKKRKIKFGGVIVIILVLYLLGSATYYIWKMPIKKVVVEGNTYLKDNYIINYLNIDNKSIVRVSKKNIKKKLLELDLISGVEIRKNYLGTLYIKVIEDKALFYNWNNKKMILSSGKEVDFSDGYLGVPTLINYVPDEIFEELVKKFNKIDKEVISLISEIEYSPSEINEKIVDSKRFLFRMNDGNVVYINTTNIEKINNYLELYEAIVNKNGNVKGCLYLDSNSENKHFNNCKEVKTEIDLESAPEVN